MLTGSLAVVAVLTCAGAAQAKGPSLADGLYRLDLTRDRLAIGEPLAVVAWFDPRAACERFLGNLPEGSGTVEECAGWIVGEEIALYSDDGWISIPLEPCGSALCGWADTSAQPAGAYQVAGISYPDPRLGAPTLELISQSGSGSESGSESGSGSGPDPDPAADPEKEIADGGGCATGGGGGAGLALLALLSAAAARPRARSRRRRPT